MEVALIAIAIGLALIVALVMQSRAAGQGAKAKGDLDATAKAVKRVEEARQKPAARGRALLDLLRRNAKD